MRININFNDGTYIYSENATTRKIGRLVRCINDKSGVCAVVYAPKYYNEFEFDNGEDFLVKITPCMEKELLDGF